MESHDHHNFYVFPVKVTCNKGIPFHTFVSLVHFLTGVEAAAVFALKRTFLLWYFSVILQTSKEINSQIFQS